MPSLPSRLAAAARAFMKPTPGLRQYSAATVRPAEVGIHYGRQGQYRAAELMAMFSGTVKVATTRNSAGVATNPLRGYRIVGRGKSMAFEGRRLSRRRRERLVKSAGHWARKAMDVDDEVEELTDDLHPVNVFLRRPNPLMSLYEMLEATQNCLGLAGNFYWKIATDQAGTPVEAWPLFPQFVHPVPDRERVIGAYVYGRGTETEQTFSPEEVVPFRYFNPRGDPYFGAGDLAACVAEARLGFQFVAIAQAMIDNGGMPGGILYGNFTENQRTQMEVSLQAKVGGAHNTGRFIVASTPEDAKFERLDVGKDAAEILTNGERVDEVVANCFDLPIEMLRMRPGGLEGDSPAIHQWQTYGLQPRGRKIEDTLNALLMPRFGDESVFLAFDPWVDEDSVEGTKVVVEMWNADLLTKNEARAEAGWDAVDDDTGDKYKSETQPEPDPMGLGGIGGGNGAIGSGNRSPPASDDAGAAKADLRSGFGADAGGAGSAGGDGAGHAGRGGHHAKSSPDHPLGYRTGVSNGRVSDDAAGRVPAATTGGGRAEAGRAVRTDALAKADAGGHADAPNARAVQQRDMLLSPVGHACCSGPPRKDDRFSSTFSIGERELEAALRALFDSIGPQVVASVTPEGGVVSLVGNPVFAQLFSQTASPIVQRMFREGLDKGVADLGARVEPARLNEALTAGATEYLREFEGKLIRTVPDTIDQAVRSQLADGIARGESLPQLQARVQDTMTSVSNYGAERIARTETARAMLTGRERAWQESGVVKGKKWLLSSDPCEFCESMARKHNEAALGQPFLGLGETLEGSEGGQLKIDYAALETPPLHPSCRCSMAAVFE